MGFWQGLLGNTESSAVEVNSGDSIDEMLGVLQGIERVEAQKLACLSYLMARVAHSDLKIDDQELLKMEKIVKDFGSLSVPQAQKISQLAKKKNELLGTEGFIVSRHLRKIASREELTKVLHCLFAIAGADDSISAEEDASLKQISSELGFSANDFVLIRSQYRSKRDVLK